MNATSPATPLPHTAAGFVRRRRPTFPGAVRAELLKIRGQKMTWALVVLGAGAAILGLVAFVTSSGPARQLTGNPTAFYFGYLALVEIIFNTVSGIVLLLLASRLVAMEYASGTIRVVLARGTGRLQLLAAQYAALAMVALFLLAGFAVLSGGFLYADVVARHGSFAPITSLPSLAWHDTGMNVLVSLASMATCILLGSAAAAVGRSMAFGVGVAMAFFPADNFGTIVMALLQRITHQDVWPRATQWFLGPNLNNLPIAAQPDHVVGSAFTPPLVPVSATHSWLLIGAYALVFLVAAVVLTWRRDVLE